MKRKAISVGDLAARLTLKPSLNSSQKVEGVSPLGVVSEGRLSFCKKGMESTIPSHRKAIIIVDSSADEHALPPGNTYLKSDNPRLSFLRGMALLYPNPMSSKLDKRAYIDSTAKLSSSVQVGAFSYIGTHCILGANVRILPNATLLGNIVIEDNVTVFPGTVIGGDGFGYERNESGDLEKFTHIGGVHIGRNVEIGSNVCIDRGTLENTVIGEGTKIDNLVHIAHNVVIGRNCEIIANAMIGGSVHIGDRTRIAPGAQIMNGVTVGNDVLVGLGAVVTKNIPANAVVAGAPAREISEFRAYQDFIKSNLRKS